MLRLSQRGKPHYADHHHQEFWSGTLRVRLALSHVFFPARPTTKSKHEDSSAGENGEIFNGNLCCMRDISVKNRCV
jgi:hypothetical protein